MNRRDALKLAALACVLPAASVARASESFQIIDPAQKADDPSKIEVLEFFHYGCPHCRDFHPLIIFYVSGALMLLFGLLIGLYVVIRSIFGFVGDNTPLFAAFLTIMGWQSVLFAMWFDMEHNKHLR